MNANNIMNAYNIEMMFNIMIWGVKPKDPHGLVTTFLESLKKINRVEDELTPEQSVKVVMGDTITLLFKLAMEADPTRRGELVKLAKELNQKYAKYLPEVVKDLGEGVKSKIKGVDY